MTITEQINMLRKYAEEVKCLFVCRLPFVIVESQKESSGEMRDSLIKCKLHIGELYSQFSEIKRYNQNRDVHLANFVKRKVTTVTYMCFHKY